MTGFRFRLEKVLEWRRTELELEEAKLQQRMGELRELDSERARLEADGIRAEVEVRGWSPLSGADLEALANYRQYVAGREQQIAARRKEARARAEEQKNAVLEARRRCQLLERLKERRQAEWQAAADRELEQLAAELHLAACSRYGR